MSNGAIFAGTLYMDRFENGAPTGAYLDVGNATEMSIDPQSEIKEQESRRKDTYGQARDSFAQVKPAQIRISLTDIVVANLAMALLGEQVTQAQSSATGQAVNVTARLGKWIDLGYRRITGVTIADAVEGQDYELNTVAGLIRFLATSTEITEGQAVSVSVTAPALVSDRVKGSAQPTIYAALRLDGENLRTGEDVEVGVYQARLRPTQPVNFISEDWTSIVLEGTLETPADKDHPFYVQYLGTPAG